MMLAVSGLVKWEGLQRNELPRVGYANLFDDFVAVGQHRGVADVDRGFF